MQPQAQKEQMAMDCLDALLGWRFERALCCHTDPIEGEEARALIKRAWAWCWD